MSKIEKPIKSKLNKEILSEKGRTILLIEERDRKDIVICAPHHTLKGVEYMPCPEHKDGDENTGFIALEIAEKLNISSIIACNYRTDSNKSLQTDFSTQILKWSPNFLIEIHGHGGNVGKKGIKPDSYTIEISSGEANNDYSLKFATLLKKKFDTYKELKKYQVIGEFNKIYFKASEAATINHDKWISFHIELPPSLRKGDNKLFPSFFNKFIKSMIETINEVCEV